MSARDELIARIRQASAPRPVRATVKPLGEVFVRVMTPYDSETARLALEKHAGKTDGLQTGRLLAQILCDEAGAPIFDADDDAQAEVLARLPNEAAEAVFKLHRKANGLVQTKEEAEALGKA